MQVLELGSYVVPGYAGMVLAEQGHSVVKWVNGADPIQSLHRGRELWNWINHGKTLERRHPRELVGKCDIMIGPFGYRPDVIIDNFRPETLERWGIDPQEIAERHGIVWVSMRDEMGERSFDLIAQARSWFEYSPWVPFWVGDTSGGLWLAFKALNAFLAGNPGHFVLGQASCMQKLVEGELVIDVEREGGKVPWEVNPYYARKGEAVVHYKGTTYREQTRDRSWKLANLWHDGGRIKI